MAALPDGFSYSIDMEKSQQPPHMTDSAKQAALEELRRRYDERLRCLSEESARARLDAFMEQDLKLGGSVLAGEGF
ncbi:hypothetical protein EIP75_00065 [Aquabacterium soli]|uniref:Uncharacterized protein n=1 Tax=Aquabacterium soli TaxID=2493092 RepID=A0A426VGG7_9BURK|nr:hypothetical protein [Aquabacterium soli]RRS06046.1 hypothetical protein EIP75_00065 [Aquabacterium soli]